MDDEDEDDEENHLANDAFGMLNIQCKKSVFSVLKKALKLLILSLVLNFNHF